MLPGPILIYECPNCKNRIFNKSLLSGNTFGSIRYSDGYLRASMLPEYPSITKCKKCGTIYWLEKTNEIERINKKSSDNILYDNYKEADFLSIEEYAEALEKNVFRSTDEEFFLRQHLLWKLNDFSRDKNKFSIDSKYKSLWESNINLLLELLDLTDNNQKIFAIELNRYKGEFELCLKLIEEISGPQFEPVLSKFIEKCKNKDEKVFVL